MQSRMKRDAEHEPQAPLKSAFSSARQLPVRTALEGNIRPTPVFLLFTKNFRFADIFIISVSPGKVKPFYKNLRVRHDLWRK